jgi:HK97 gp10 family phage protein
MASNMPTLNDIANQFQSLAKLNIQRAPNRAIDTGKLRDSINVKKTRTNKAGGAMFDLDTVYYGVFVEDGTVNMKARPFAKEAADSDTLKAMVDDYMKSVVQLTVMDVTKANLDKNLKKYSAKP